MLGPETLPLLPYAPVLPVLPAYIPPDVDMDVVLAEVAADGVSADPADEAGLQQVVAQAQGQGIDLKVVVIDTNPPIDTPCAISPPWSPSPTPTRRCWC